MNYFVYILKSSINNDIYIGSTENIEKRLAKHNRGEVQSTKAYRPWEMMQVEIFPSRQEARKRELRIKSWKSRKAIEKLIGPIV